MLRQVEYDPRIQSIHIWLDDTRVIGRGKTALVEDLVYGVVAKDPARPAGKDGEWVSVLQGLAILVFSDQMVRTQAYNQRPSCSVERSGGILVDIDDGCGIAATGLSFGLQSFSSVLSQGKGSGRYT